jgi:hypothetical protein
MLKRTPGFLERIHLKRIMKYSSILVFFILIIMFSAITG